MLVDIVYGFFKDPAGLLDFVVVLCVVLFLGELDLVLSVVQFSFQPVNACLCCVGVVQSFLTASFFVIEPAKAEALMAITTITASVITDTLLIALVMVILLFFYGFPFCFVLISVC